MSQIDSVSSGTGFRHGDIGEQYRTTGSRRSQRPPIPGADLLLPRVNLPNVGVRGSTPLTQPPLAPGSHKIHNKGDMKLKQVPRS